MRDPSRIDYYCDELAELWHKVPDWRFGQLVCNAINAWNITQKCHTFYAEDADFMKFLNEYINEMVSKDA